MTDENGTPITETPPEVQRALSAVTRQRQSEGALVILVAVLIVGLVAATAYNTYKMRSLTQRSVESQDFGLKAVECILDNFSEHRWSNQSFHDSLADFLHAARTPHTPLPNLPTDEQFNSDCAPFDAGRTLVPVTQPSLPGSPPTTPRPTATTIMGGHDVSTTTTRR